MEGIQNKLAAISDVHGVGKKDWSYYLVTGIVEIYKKS